MKRQNLFSYLLLASILSMQLACNTAQNARTETRVNQNILTEVRLGDGIPLSLHTTLRWTISDSRVFYSQFESPNIFNQEILIPRSLEIAKKTSNKFDSVDSVFSVDRDIYIAQIKNDLTNGLIEEGITVREVIVSDISFPGKFISAKETVGLKEQELERIRQEKVVNIERAKALKEQVSADGQVDIARAEAEGKVQNIKAKTEKTRRKAEVAIAETEAQVERMKAKAEADKNRSLAEAEVEKVRDMKNIDVQKKREMEQIAIDKVKQLDRVEFERQIQLAKLCQENPTYATFLVNKELASKVDIAVLPSGGERNVFDNIINNNMPGQ